MKPVIVLTPDEWVEWAADLIVRNAKSVERAAADIVDDEAIRAGTEEQ